MKLSEVKSILNNAESVDFALENGTPIPEHFHVTEVGVITKDFIDCGGTVRHERVANFQLWNANDYDHRLKPQNLLKIITLSEKVLGLGDLEIEVEYQAETIGKYDLGFANGNFILKNKQTNCLALDLCGLPTAITQTIKQTANACTPGGGCC